MENTSGFYKNDNECLLYGPNYVLAGSYNLYKEENSNYTYPIGGWYWFDSEEEARQFFGMPLKLIEPPLQNNIDITNNIGN
jgi:hypothetical protein